MIMIDNVKLKNKYNIDVNYYMGKDIDFYSLSVRTTNCLSNRNITKIIDLLELSYEDLSKIRNFGRKCLEDIDKYLEELKKIDVSTDDLVSKEIKEVKDLIFTEKFDEIREVNLTDKELSIVSMMKQSFQVLDKDLILACRDNPNYIRQIVSILSDYTKIIDLKEKIREGLNCLGVKLYNGVDEYFKVYSPNKLSDPLTELIFDHDYNVKDLGSLDVVDYALLNKMYDFINWMNYDLRNEVDVFFERCFQKNQRAEKVLRLRASKHTLQEVGDEMGVTRERVRQMEAKVISPFRDWHKNSKFLPRLVADFNGKKIIEAIELQALFGNNTEILLYLLQCVDDETFSYDKQTDTLIIETDNITDRARLIIAKLPDNFDANQLIPYIDKIAEDTNISKNILLREVNSQYKISGNHYHRSKLSLTKIYSIVLRKYYPFGMHIYDAEEIDRFKSYVIKEFGEVNLPDNNRAISARIASESVLCGRGIYKAKEKNYIPEELSNKILDFILNSDKTIFLTNTIFTEFEDELARYGVCNRYYLHGILRELFEDRLFFTRDYVSKDANSLSIYRDIVLFVKNSQYPVTKQQIRDAYPGITEIVLSLAVSDESILNYRSSYVHVDNIKIYDSDIDYLKSKIDMLCANDNLINCRDLYDLIAHDNDEMMKRLGVFYQSSLFSLIEYLFREQYEFSRPYIATKGTEIDKPSELIEEYVLSNDYVEVSEIFEMAKDYHFMIPDQLKYLCSFIDTHMLVNKEEMASIEYIGVRKEDAEIIEKTILEEIEGTVLISDLKCISRFPKIKVPWNEWLLYCMILKWGKELEVGTTSNQFKLSSPVISRKNELSLDNIDTSKATSSVGIVDDIEDYDAISSSLLDDIEW